MRKVPRHKFVPPELADHAYMDQPLAIGHDQTISQPYIVAYMTQCLDVKPGDKILEVGTGCGYQAAVLAELGAHVFTVEIIQPLAQAAEERLKALGCESVRVRIDDGFHGWYEEAPFDGILVAAAPLSVPIPLRNQLKVGGRMVIPVGGEDQRIKLITRTHQGFEERDALDVRFVPMTGEIERGRPWA
jgi:protein-L-isoaspartate(D-aspartate) O-methyltransferase